MRNLISDQKNLKSLAPSIALLSFLFLQGTHGHAMMPVLKGGGGASSSRGFFSSVSSLFSLRPSLPERVSSLTREKRFQEALWIGMEERTSKAELDKLKTQLLTAIASDAYSMTKPTLGGVSEKTVLVFKDDIKALFKSDGGTKAVPYESVAKNFKLMEQYAADANSEVAASKLDELLNLNIVPTTVLKNAHGIHGSLQVMVENYSPGVNHFEDHEYRGFPSYGNMQVLDFLAGNGDRHDGNWLFLNDLRRIVAIDHGLSFRRGEGGCIYDGKLYSTFGYGLESCAKLIANIELAATQSLRTKSEEVTPEKIKAIVTSNLEEALVPFDCSRLSPQTQSAISTLSAETLRETLRENVQPHYLELVVARLADLKSVCQPAADGSGR